MKQNKIFSLLGLAAKSRNLVSGEFMTEKAVKEGKAFRVIVASDASDNTKKNFTNMCEFYKVPLMIYATKEELGHGIGKQMRASVAITDKGFADAINKKLNEA
ncbi:MAG: ribosomal L7Ae/L30e/S12e/Gadd45 family protein [Eubacteriales bacterium]